MVTAIYTLSFEEIKGFWIVMVDLIPSSDDAINFYVFSL